MRPIQIIFVAFVIIMSGLFIACEPPVRKNVQAKDLPYTVECEQPGTDEIFRAKASRVTTYDGSETRIILSDGSQMWFMHTKCIVRRKN